MNAMKRIITVILAIILSVPAFSQKKQEYKQEYKYEEIMDDLKEEILDAVENSEDKDYSPLIWESEDGQFKLFTVSHIGYGLYFINNSDFVAALSGEFFVNIARLGFYPIPDWGLEINLDYGHNALRSSESVLLMDGDREVYSVPGADFYPASASWKRSSLEFSSLNFPFLFKHDYGEFSFGLGTEVSINFLGRTRYKYTVDHNKYSCVGKRAAINTFTYAFEATVSYDDMGLFIKWYPKHSGILSGRALDMRNGYVSIGLCFGL